MSKTLPLNNKNSNMTSRRAARKKANRFETLDEAVEEYKEPDTIEPSSVTNDPDLLQDELNPDMDPEEHQVRTNDRLDHLEETMSGIADALSIIQASIEDIRSRQNDGSNQAPPPTFDPNQPTSSTTNTVNTPVNNTYSTSYTPTPTPPVPNPPVNFVPTPPGHQATPSHKYWKIARDDNFEPHRFQNFVKDIKLMDDSLHSIRLFYSKIRHAMHTSFKRHTDVLPTFDKLTRKTDFTQLLVPNNDQYIGYSSIISIYQWFSDSISNIMLDTEVINPKRTPKAHQIVLTYGNINDGWKILYQLLTKTCPFLGEKTLDVASEITHLKIHSSDTIHTFFKRVQDIETKLLYSRETIDKTRLLSFYLKAMATSTVHYNLIQHFISDLNYHINIYGSNIAHPLHTCSSVYDYLVTIEAPATFSFPSKNNYKNHKNSTYKSYGKQGYESGYSTSTISALEHLPDILDTSEIIETIDNLEITENEHEQDPNNNTSNNEIDTITPFISAFRRTSNIICDACGGRGHHAQKCFKRGRNFLPRDVQRRIAAYNAKHGDSPTSDSSVPPEKSYHALPPPDHRPPTANSTNDPMDNQLPTNPTISQIDHLIPTPTIEELLDNALGTPNEPTINALQTEIQDKLPIMTSKSSLFHTIIDNKGNVLPKYLQYYQTTYLNKYPSTTYTTYRQAIFHIDSGANVHASNDKSDFIIFHPTKNTINLAAGTKAISEGIGAILLQLSLNEKPIIIAPVYYCPTAKVSTLSPGAIKTYNGYYDVNLRIFKALEYRHTTNSTIQSITTTVYNNMDYLALPILQIEQNTNDTTNKPAISSISNQYHNNQYIHQKFDHRNMQMILRMKRQNLMQGLPSDISTFHENYNCPICKIANATKISTNKTSDRIKLKPGSWFCIDYSFWNCKSIRGFTSLLTVICLSTRYSFVFPTRNKRPPLDTIRWFIKTLRRQGFPVLYIQTDEGGELGRSSDFLQLLTDSECIYMGTGRSGSSFNGLVERPNRTIANSVRAKLLNASLPDEFWCYAAEDANFKLRRMLHTSIHITPYQAWTGKKPQYSDMKIWGSHVYVVDTDVTRAKLDKRTYVGLFMKFSATTKIIIFYNPKTRKFGRTSHAYFDELNIGKYKDLPTTSIGKQLVQKYPHSITDIDTSTVQSDITKLPILHEPAVTFEVYLPPIDSSCPIKFFRR